MTKYCRQKANFDTDMKLTKHVKTAIKLVCKVTEFYCITNDFSKEYE